MHAVEGGGDQGYKDEQAVQLFLASRTQQTQRLTGIDTTIELQSVSKKVL